MLVKIPRRKLRLNTRMGSTLQDYSKEVQEKLEYCQKMLVHLTKKGVTLNTHTNSKGILTHVRLEVSH